MTLSLGAAHRDLVGDPLSDDPHDQAALLAAVGERLSIPPRDRDPLLWAAHESLHAARLLLEAHDAGPVDQREYLAAALAQARSATVSLHYALRERT